MMPEAETIVREQSPSTRGKCVTALLDLRRLLNGRSKWNIE